MSVRLSTYDEFWMFYLRQHSSRNCRVLHYVGTSVALVFIALLIFVGNLWYLLGAVAAGYSFAWVGHFFIARNRPATFTYPVWSIFSDFRMYFLALTGCLDSELKKANAP